MNTDKYVGKRITRATLDCDQAVRLTFDDGVTIQIWDAGQDCCERRYMSTDDKVSDLVGQPLVSIEVKESSESRRDSDEDHDVVEIAFLEIRAGYDTVTFANYNEHNGYYGGFDITISEVGKP